MLRPNIRAYLRMFCAVAIFPARHFAVENAGEETNPRAQVDTVRFDGVSARFQSGQALSVPAGTRDIEVGVGLSPAGADGVRVRYRLAGYDSDWQDPPTQMRVVVHFLDARGVEVGASHALVKGASSGWRSKVEQSAFVAQNLDAVVPSRAERAYLEFVSGGSEATLGIYAFRELACDVTGLDEQTRHLSFPMESGIELGDALGVPAGWERIGSKPEMAVVLPLGDASSHHTLVLRDVSAHAYCGWRLSSSRWFPVRAGEKVRVHWRHCFSMGAAGGAIARYRFLRPGGYRFQILAAHVSGEPLGQSSELALRVQAPLWQRPWLWILGALGLVAAVAFGVRRLTKHRMQRKLAELDRQRALESERTRIAQDIHDDLGAGLAQIVMLSELAQMDAPEQDPRRAQLEEIGSRAQDAGRKLDEIVWAINPAHDSAEDLVGYLARFAQGYLSLAQIRFRLDVPPALPEIGLTSRQRHQIFLAAKEAIHNAVKHGAPSEITVRVRMVDECLVITVTDDGCGFADTEQIVTARGSANMKNRMEKIGGSFQRQSRRHGGTSVTFQLPLNCIVP